MKRRDQEMTKAAVELVSSIDTLTPEIRTRLIGLPHLLHRNGLAATLAFIASKSAGEGSLAQAYRKVDELLAAQIKASNINGAENFKSISDPAGALWLGHCSPRNYMRLSAEIADVFVWVKRLAEASCVQPASNGSEKVTDE